MSNKDVAAFARLTGCQSARAFYTDLCLGTGYQQSVGSILRNSQLG